MHRIIGRVAAATIACLLTLGLTATTASSETEVGAIGWLALGGNELDLDLVQTLQSALDSQFVGIEVAVVRGRLVLSGYASPGVHSAVVFLLADLLQKPIPVPVALDILGPNLGLPLPFLDLGAGIAIPDLSSVLNVLGVVDHIRIAR